MHTITLHTHDSQKHTITISAEDATQLTLAQCIFTSGKIAAPALCSGIGTCGACKVRFREAPPTATDIEQRYLSEQDLHQGWRLSCRHALTSDCTLDLPEQRTRSKCSEISQATAPSVKVAIDLGTTSIYWRAINTNTSGGKATVVAEGSQLNPQMGAGSEVMSRLAFAQTPNGSATLQSLVTDAIRSIISSLGVPVTECCVAGNSVMTYLLLGKDTNCLASAPYSLSFTGGTTEPLFDGVPTYIPPLPSPFVGADLSAGYAAILAEKPEYPFLLADLGTNGEFILATSPDTAFVTSVALGPALEGIGLRHGTVAGTGAITKFTYTPAGLQAFQLNAQGQLSPLAVAVAPHGFSSLRAPVADSANDSVSGISGTGYLSLVHALLKVGLIQQDGRFATAPFPPLATRLGQSLTTLKGETALPLGYGINASVLAASDVEELLKVKAAFTLAFERLLHDAALQAGALKTIYIAGALGEHVAVEDLEGLGFIPAGLAHKVRSIGNSSLCGAEQFLVDPSLRSVAEDWAAQVTSIDLTASSSFTHSFMRHMRFIYS